MPGTRLRVTDARVLCVEELEAGDAFLATVVEGVHAAGNPYLDYLFGAPDVTRGVLHAWVRRRSSEVSAHRARVLQTGGRIAGGYLLLSGDDLRRSRSADLLALLTARGPVSRAEMQARLAATRNAFGVVEPGDAYLSKIWVSDEFRGRGISRALVSSLLALASSWGAARVVLDVHAGNAPAIALYTRAGFERVSHQRTEVPALEYLTLARTLGAAPGERSPDYG